MLRVLQSWILVGALLIGLFLGLLDMGASAAADAESLFDQILGFLCIFGAATALVGPIIMNSVMYLCASSVSTGNYDVLAAASRSFMQFSEALTWGMCFACMVCFSLLPFVIFADREALVEYAPPVDALNSRVCAWVCFALCGLLLFVMLLYCNTLCAAVMHSGMLCEHRLEDVDVWSGTHDSHEAVVDSIVRMALRHGRTEDLMAFLAEMRGRDAAEVVDGATSQAAILAHMTEGGGDAKKSR